MNPGKPAKTHFKVPIIEQKSGSKTRNESSCKACNLKSEEDEDDLEDNPRQVVHEIASLHNTCLSKAVISTRGYAKRQIYDKGNYQPPE